MTSLSRTATHASCKESGCKDEAGGDWRCVHDVFLIEHPVEPLGENTLLV